MKSLNLIPFIACLSFIIGGCQNTSVVNKDVIEKGTEVWLNHRNELKQITPICDQLFLSKCNVYYILTSPTTDLYDQGVWIDDLYYDGCIIEPKQSQIDKVISLIPHPKIDDIYYLKSVFTAFGLSYLSKENDALFLVQIDDIDKFNQVYNLKIYDMKNDDSITDGWMKKLDDKWYICSANLIHNGSDEVCAILNE